MNVTEQLLKTHSRANTDLIVDWVGQNQDRYDQLFAIAMSDDKDLARRASWPLSYASVRWPELVQSSFPQLFSLLDRVDSHPAIQRNCLYIFRHIAVPEEYDGELIHRCFLFISNPLAAVAVQASALYILRRYLPKYPDLRDELIAVIEPQLSNQKAAYKVQARRILNEAYQKKK